MSVSDGGVITANITQSGNNFSGTLTTEGTPGIKSADSSCNITKTTFSSTGTINGRINGNTIEFTMGVKGNTSTLEFTGTAPSLMVSFSGKFVRSTGWARFVQFSLKIYALPNEGARPSNLRSIGPVFVRKDLTCCSRTLQRLRWRSSPRRLRLTIQVELVSPPKRNQGRGFDAKKPSKARSKQGPMTGASNAIYFEFAPTRLRQRQVSLAVWAFGPLRFCNSRSGMCSDHRAVACTRLDHQPKLGSCFASVVRGDHYRCLGKKICTTLGVIDII